MVEATVTRPYLDDSVGFDRMPTLLQWAKYLGTTFGTAGALSALRYYERLSWISEGVRRDVEQHLQGLSLEEMHSKKYDEPGLPSEPLDSLSGTPFGAHAVSLEFIADLADDDIASEMLRIELAKQQAEVELPQPDADPDDALSRMSPRE